MEKKIQVLVVDDEADFRHLMTFWLKSKGYSAIAAAEGKSAIRLVKRKNPDIILLDIRMPIMDGVETIKKIRKFNTEVPVILISAYVNDPKTKDVMSYGVSGIFYKGKNFEEALPLLESALRTHKQLKEK